MPASLGYSKIDKLGSAKSISSGTMGIPSFAMTAFIQVEGAPIRWRDDGKDPSATDGFLLNDEDSMNYDKNLTSLKFIEVQPSAIVHVSFYKD